MTRPKPTKIMHNYRDSRVGLPCPKCGKIMGNSSKNDSDSATCEHIVPLDDGGQNVISNIEIICGACQSANNSVKQYFKIRGEIVPPEYWTLSLDMLSFGHLVECFYSQFHGIFLEKRARFN